MDNKFRIVSLLQWNREMCHYFYLFIFTPTPSIGNESNRWDLIRSVLCWIYFSWLYVFLWFFVQKNIGCNSILTQKLLWIYKKDESLSLRNTTCLTTCNRTCSKETSFQNQNPRTIHELHTLAIKYIRI